MNALATRIASLIQAQGPITVAQYMTQALHDPDYGYYAVGNPLGSDFVTAPEITQVFGELLGLWAAQCWHDQGKPTPARLAELGPGRGTLMEDALRAASLMPEFCDAIEVVLVDSNPSLIAAQKETLEDAGIIRWCGRFEDVGMDRPLFLIANEFFDAMAVRQFVMTERGWCERMVTLDDTGELAFALSPDPTPLSLPDRGPAEPGAVYETSPACEALAEEIALAVVHQGGGALIIDYGYGAGAPFGETLQALGGSQFKELLDSPGDNDLSAHVDFDMLARVARDNGAAVYGPIGQGAFLEALGARKRAEVLDYSCPGEAASVERLISPDEMGVLFKVLAILPKTAPRPPGF
ncbi:MAG TPA: SAM-dependent methyltransferase [Rhizomicrobium sp.]